MCLKYIYDKRLEFLCVSCVFIDQEIVINHWIVMEWLIIPGLCEKNEIITVYIPTQDKIYEFLLNMWLNRIILNSTIRVQFWLHHVSACKSYNLLRRYASENRSSLRVVTGKWLLKTYKLTRKLKIKSEPINKLNTIKRAMSSV